MMLGDDGHELAPGELGAIAVKLPLPPGTCRRCGTPTTASRRPICTTSRATTRPAMRAYRDEDGYLYIMARTDDVINVAGHRLSTGAMEEVLAAHPDVAECAVIGVADELKGQLPMGFLCLNMQASTGPSPRSSPNA
jgi:propionyl-CoA synthetase